MPRGVTAAPGDDDAVGRHLEPDVVARAERSRVGELRVDLGHVHLSGLGGRAGAQRLDDRVGKQVRPVQGGHGGQ